MSRSVTAAATAAAGLLLALGLSTPSRPVFANFHCMRIHAVMAGFNGNENVQFVELRMNLGGQTVLGGHKLRFVDSTGTQQAEFTFPSGVTNGLKGDSILIATKEFNDAYTPGNSAKADFEFSLDNTTGMSVDDRLHPVQGSGGVDGSTGKVIFEPTGLGCSGGVPPIDSVAYGTGTGTFTAAPYGTSAVALPDPSDNRGLQLNNLNSTPTDNSTEYADPMGPLVGGLQPVSTTLTTIAGVAATLEADQRFPRTNGRMLLLVAAPPSSVGGITDEPRPDDAEVGVADEGSGAPLALIGALSAAVLVVATGGAGIFAMRRPLL